MRFDYIVVGAGSAGCVLAARLSESGAKVLLLEAGGKNDHLLVRMPLAFLKLLAKDELVWRFMSEAEPGAQGRKLPLPRGRGLGGTSTINGMVYARGCRQDYDDWRAAGLEGWGYDDVLPYFKRLESSWRGDTPAHGGDGPVGVTETRLPIVGFDALARAAQLVGHDANADPAAESLDGLSRMELTVSRGERASAAAAYLAPVRDRRNLIVATGALVRRLLIERDRVIGVEFERNGAAQTVWAEQETILCAGAYGSPQILMLSGIGPADELRTSGVEPVCDLPGVGRNLCEHPLAHLGWVAATDRTFLRTLRYDRAILGVAEWMLRRTGPFATNGVAANLYLRTSADLDRPDIKLVCGSIGLDAALWFPGLTKPPVHRFTCGVSLLRAHSRGRVTLHSADPHAAPRISLNLFDDPRDMAALVAGVKAARALYAQEPLHTQIAYEVAPGVDVRSDADIEATIRKTGGIGHHPAGTCAMGVGRDAVVDANLRLVGLSGLRIADASVMPGEVTGNINVPVMMIAEKAVDLIRYGAAPAPKRMEAPVG